MSVIQGPNGTMQGVTSDGRSMVQSTRSDSTIDQILQGWGFTVVENTVTPTGAGDCFLYLGNDSSDQCVVDRIQINDAGAETIYLVMSDTYTLATTHAVVDSAMNRSGSSNVLSTKMTAEAGVDITGIAGTTYRIHDIEAGAGTQYANILGDAKIVIPPNMALSFFAATGTAAITNIAVDLHFLMDPRVNL